MMKFLEIFIGCIIMWLAAYLVGNILFQEKNKSNILRKIFVIIISSILLTGLNIVNSEILGGTVKILCVYSLQCLFYKLMFNKTLAKTMVISLILYICLCASEVIIALVASVTLNNIHSSLEFLKNTIVINALVSLSLLAIVRMIKKWLITFVNNSKFEGKNNLLILFIILITIALLVYKVPVTNWNFNFEFIITMIISLCFCIIGIYMLKQKSDIQKTMSMYQQLAEHSNITNSVLEEYRVVTHEHKNQLLIIRSMLENKDKEINDYVDNLLEKREAIKYKWIGELNHLPLSGLKGLINYKILEMESLKLNKVISISKEVSKLKLDKLPITQKDNLYSIIGIYLDNAIQAAKESKTKEVNIDVYKEEKELVIIIANTYKGKVELEQIDNYGYTTKGKNHGVGLHIVKNILQKETIYVSKRYLLDNYFVQEIRIDLNAIKSK